LRYIVSLANKTDREHFQQRSTADNWSHNMLNTLKATGVIFIFFITIFQSASANQKLVFGQSIKLTSDILGEEREILIRVPRDYDESKDTRYPVLYTLDGATHFKHTVGTIEWLSESASMLPQHIVVAIVNTDRFRDFSPSIPKNFQGEGNPGGANNFLKFLSKELIPYIDKNYRTLPFRTIAGHSFGGVFVLHTLLTDPSVFQAHIAMAPHVIYDDGEIVRQMNKILSPKSDLQSFLFTTLGNEPNRHETYQEMIKVLSDKAPQSLEWHNQLYPRETHMSVPSKTLHNALIELRNYAGWNVAPELVAQGSIALKVHYQKLSSRFGYLIPVPERAINLIGYEYLTNKNYDRAIRTFKLNVELHPNSANVYDSLSDAYERKGDLQKALNIQQKAVKLATTRNNQRELEYINGRLNTLKSKVSNDN